jgi:LisH
MHPFERKMDKPSKSYVGLREQSFVSLCFCMMPSRQVGNLSENPRRKLIDLLTDLHSFPVELCLHQMAETRRLTFPVDRDINNLIMDYLVTEGYPSAAQKFATEANIQPKADLESIKERVEIRDLIHRGDLQTAIEKINELNPQVRVPLHR